MVTMTSHGYRYRVSKGNTERRCCKCKEFKPDSEYYKEKKNPDGLKYKCKQCSAVDKRTYRKKNPDVSKKEYERRKLKLGTFKWEAIKSKYGLSREGYEAMVSAQEGMCALCGERPVKHVDHCHETGRVRGLLCVQCNTGLGKFNDSPELLKKAVEYLEDVDGSTRDTG